MHGMYEVLPRHRNRPYRFLCTGCKRGDVTICWHGLTTRWAALNRCRVASSKCDKLECAVWNIQVVVAWPIAGKPGTRGHGFGHPHRRDGVDATSPLILVYGLSRLTTAWLTFGNTTPIKHSRHCDLIWSSAACIQIIRFRHDEDLEAHYSSRMGGVSGYAFGTSV